MTVDLDERYIGSSCELSNMSNEVVGIGKLEGLPNPDNEFTLSITSKTNRFPVLAYHTILKIHVRNTTFNSVFLLGKVEICKADLISLSDIQLIAHDEKRDAFRVRFRKKTAFYKKGERRPAGILLFLDISMGGFMCKSKEKLDAAKRYLVEVPMEDGTYLFQFSVVRTLPAEQDDVYVYGCQFKNIGEKQLDTLARFVFSLQKASLSSLSKYSD